MINDVKKFIAERLRDEDLYAKVLEMLQHVLDDSEIGYNDIIQKYNDPAQLDPEATEALLAEFGFSYIGDIFSLFEAQDLVSLVRYLNFISLMKGHRDGLEVILEFLGLDYEIVEWWEGNAGEDVTYDYSPPNTVKTLAPHEWKMTINLITSSHPADIAKSAEAIILFTRNYVYPVLQWLELVYEDTYGEYELMSHGVDDKIHKLSFTGLFKTITSKCATDKVAWFNADQDAFENAPLFDNNLLRETGYTFLTEDDTDILKLEDF